MRKVLAFILAVVLVACSKTSPADASATEEKLVPEGWREAVFSVSDLDHWIEYYTIVLGWEVREAGTVSDALLTAWGLPEEATASFVLVANPGSETGFVRIIDFDNVPQRRIREHDQPWETGGIFNINKRVSDMATLSEEVTNAGWQAQSAPVRFTFGPFVVWEWIPRHPDGVRTAFIERVEPPLEGWPNLKTTSRTFNSTQMVKDIDRALTFYRDVLGFETYLEHNAPSKAPGENVLGLSREAMTDIARHVVIVHPQGQNEGSIELLQYMGYTGRDFSEHAVPPNLGILMLRFPVPDVDALAEHLQNQGVPISTPLVITELKPYGQVKILAVLAPDGAWLEFFQQLDD
jgi:catechol 2,3-dioxygenase-like lactoylglutathione lyase family enzyme